MSSIREQILSAMVAQLNAGSIGAPVYRSRTEAISRAQSPAVVVSPVMDAAVQTVIPKLQWKLMVHVMVFTRGPSPDVLADPILTAANAALMADTTFGGLANIIVPSGVHFEFSDADAAVCVATAQFEVEYRTDMRDLTSQ